MTLANVRVGGEHIVWGRDSGLAAEAVVTQNDIIGLVGGVVATGLVVTIVVIALRYRRRVTGVRARAVIAPAPRALPPPPYPEAGITAPITAPGHLQSPKVDFEPPCTQVVRTD